MIRRLCILCFLVALWPGLALAQSAALMDAFNQSQALYKQGRCAEAEPFARKALELSQREFGPDHPTTGSLEVGAAEVGPLEVGDAEDGPLEVGQDEFGLSALFTIRFEPFLVIREDALQLFLGHRSVFRLLGS